MEKGRFELAGSATMLLFQEGRIYLHPLSGKLAVLDRGTGPGGYPRRYRQFFLWMAAAVCLSALTTKQHVAADVVGGIALAETGWWAAGLEIVDNACILENMMLEAEQTEAVLAAANRFPVGSNLYMDVHITVAQVETKLSSLCQTAWKRFSSKDKAKKLQATP